MTMDPSLGNFAQADVLVEGKKNAAVVAAGPDVIR
jgi:hypothetical protein